MAKTLAFKRATREVVTIDTVNGALTTLGAPLAVSELTALFPGRCNNLLAIYRGDAYILYRSTTNEIRLARLTAGVWTDVPGFTPITTGSGNLSPAGLQVERGWLVASYHLSGSAGVDGTGFRRTADGVTYDPPVFLLTPIQPTTSEGGNTVVWKNVIWQATRSGLVYYNPSTDTIAGAFDTGSDGGLNAADTMIGCFALWNGSLYFARGGSVPVIYRLDANWLPTAPTGPPAWTKIAATGFNSCGTVTVGPDAGTTLLFVDKQDNLCVLYSGSLSSRLARSTVTAFPAFTDVTGTYLPPEVSTDLDLGFDFYVDDRRRTNELQTIIIRDPTGNSVKIMPWDGVNAMSVRATFTGTQLMSCDDRFGELRTYTGQQPAAFMSSTSQPFPGRVAITYSLIDTASRPLDVFGEYSVDGDQWNAMTQGEGDDGNSLLTSSPGGTVHVFFWDAFVDLDDDLPFVYMRIVARIAGV
jgi:hypothetical protein